MLLGLRSLWEEQTPVTGQEPYGLARLFYWQREQEELKRKKRRKEEEELMVLLGIEM